MKKNGSSLTSPLSVLSAVAAVTVVALVACESGGDATTASLDSGTGTTGVDSSTGSDTDSGAVENIPDAGPLSYDAAWDDSSAAMVFDSGASSCGFPSACPQTRGLTGTGAISGDTSPANNTVSTTGTTSEWITVRVSEDYNNAVLGRALSITAKLTSAAGTDYDLFVYTNDGSAKAECTKVAAQSSDPGAVDTVSTSWGEGAVPNGKDDSLTVTIRVQHISGPCDALDPWKLEVTGHTK
jgi:hypothetical protein